VRRPQLAKRFRYGREAIKRVIWAGMRYGWIVANKTRLPNGKISVVYEVRDEPGPPLSDEDIRAALSLGSSGAADADESDGADAHETGDPPASGDPPPTGEPATAQPGVAQPATANPYVVSIEEATKDGFTKAAADMRATALVSEEAHTIADEIVGIMGHDPKNPPSSWFGAPYRVQQWLLRGWPRPLIIASVREQAARPRARAINGIKYFEPGIADAVASSKAPLPDGTAVAQSKGRSNETGGSVIAATDRLIDRIRAFGSSGQGRVRGGAGEDAIRQLPQGRRE
jgi:hypothetical protein